MSSGGAITPPQNNATQMSPFGSASAQQQQQQLQATLSHLFPSGMPFNFPHFDALSPTASANGAIGPSIRHLHFDGFPNHHNSRIKIKRCRQRVDAGEPRNAYQSQLKNGGGQRKDSISLNDLSQQLTLNFDTHSNSSSHSPFRIRNGSTPSENDYADEADGVDNGEHGALNFSLSVSKSVSSSTSSIISSSAKRKSFCPRRQQADEDENVSHSNNNNNIDEASEEKMRFDVSDSAHDDNSKNVSSLKLVINRRHNTVSNVVQDAEERENDKLEYSSEHDSDSDSEMLKTNNGQVDENREENTVQTNEVEFPAQAYSKGGEEIVSERSSPAESATSNLLTSLFLPNNNNNNNANNNNAESKKCENNEGSEANRIQSILVAQRKMYSAIFMEQQRKSLSASSEAVEDATAAKDQLSGSSSLLFPQNVGQEAKTAPPINGIFGQRKPSGNEHLMHLFRFIEAMTLAQRQQQMIEMFQQQQKLRCHSQQQQTQQQHLNPRVQNLLAMAATAAAATAVSGRNVPTISGSHPAFRFGESNSSIGNGIFPASGTMPTPFPNLIGSSLFPPSASLRDDCGPRRKRAKVTDSVRAPRSGLRTNCVSANSPPASSERSSPLAAAAYFPPTMVAHPSLYGRASSSRNDSPTNASDELGAGDYFGGSVGGLSINALEGLNPQKYTLNHVHLRKAKLMFFYTRYPSSAVLKTYFPDIQFNKNNTAQLVKWFSNFREFYYMQMEKYAKQAIAEGVRHRNDIIVTQESEIYKQLNQHYNRNNLLQPPPRLQYVIQETLKEFFVALQAGTDSEPSWKKVIYKIIQQYDDPIPEYFKDPNFIETLEQS